MHVSITCKVTSKNFLVSFMYGLHLVVAHRPLWNSLTQFGNSVHVPWLVPEDFNSVLSGSDRNGNAHVSSYEVRDFLHYYVDLGFVDLNSTRYRYTWTNNTAWSKIDRAMCNQSWFDSRLQTITRFLPIGCLSDHSPYIVSLFELPRSPKNYFMFFNIWCAHKDFLQLVETGWDEPIVGRKQFALCRKLKLLKSPLKSLNKKHFGHISTKADLAREGLKMAQSSLYDNPQDITLREIHFEFLTYYSNFLGTRDDVDDFDATMMDFCPKVSTLLAESLIWGIPLLGVYLKVVDYAPLIDKISKTLLAWAGLNLSYVGRLEVIHSMIQGEEGFPTFRDKIIEVEGPITNAIRRLSSWHLGGSFVTSSAYVFFRPMEQKKIWHKVVWNPINPPKFSFIFGLLLWDDFLRWIDFISCRLIRLASFATRWRRHTHTCSLAAFLPKRSGDTLRSAQDSGEACLDIP
ncbi:hypothetical protein M9H77_27400 [Catharanthus roseus]|uniref:Uncharacterized protein n=1 Tax=Catharanthus roseus TaxID=4058 RepID=A0ACC0AF42_CATRO|nr:hypothetical protein M9H77_27400 [Catharanthus roseus]